LARAFTDRTRRHKGQTIINFVIYEQCQMN
jgi:hypothetical protein